MGRGGSGVKKATEGSIEITFTYLGKRCRERIKLKPTAANLKKCERHREAILESIAAGTFDYAVTFPNSKRANDFLPEKELTVGEWLWKWLDSKEKMLKSSTYDGYRKAIKGALIPALGHIALSKLRKKDVRDWLQKLDCSNKRIANIISPLREALQHAYDDELITENVLFNFRYVRNEPPKESDVDPFTAEEQALILAQLEGEAKNLIQFAFWTGLRTSELIALEWRDIDFKKGVINVQRAKTQAAAKAETTKTRAGVRQVKLLHPALDAIRNQGEGFKHGSVVFHNPKTEMPWFGDSALRKTLWTPALKRAGVKYRRPYQTRHTFASYLISSGENIAWISSQLGHANVLMTIKCYARYIPESGNNLGERAVKLFWGNNE